ncbi:MAG: DUF11 domain-containing protein [Clostridia bacterium]|nr:DUF11 domain-containing protein [Clostridia bacterium]
MNRMKNRFKALLALAALLVLCLTAAGALAEKPAHQHSWVTEYETPATCTEAGFRLLSCYVCGEAREESIKPLGHDLIQVYEAPTCQKPGYSGVRCSRCGYATGKEIPQTGHSWVTVSETAATCTQGGVKEVQCEYCGKREVQQTKALGHSWQEINEAPSCKKGGFTGVRCSRCGLQDGKETPAAGHSYGAWQILNDDCTEGQAQRTCSRCGLVHRKEYKGSTHTWGEWEVTTPATASQEGEETRVCQKCGIWETRPIPMQDFVFGLPGMEGLTLIVNQASFSSAGFEAYDEVTFNWTIVNASDQDCALKGIACAQGEKIPTSAGDLAVPLAKGGGSLSGSADVTVFPFDDGTAAVRLIFQGFVTLEDGAIGCTNHVTLYLPVTASRNWTPPSVTSAQDVKVMKSVLSSPSSPAGYQLGETVEYQVTVTNQGATALPRVEVSDPVADRSSLAAPKGTAALGPGETASFTFRRTVGALDAASGFIANTAFASWSDPSSGETLMSASNTVVVQVLSNTAQPGLTVAKTILNPPGTLLANGALGFVPGDTIQYEITITNPTADPCQNVQIFDTLGSGAIGQFSALAPGETQTLRFQYTVTAADAAAGVVSNMAAALYDDASGMQRCAFSAAADAPAGDPHAGFARLEISKRETSAPRNGLSYQPGETIQYRITVRNTGSMALRSVSVMDSLAPSGGAVDTLTNLQPGQSHDTTFAYTVTSADARRASLTSRASAVYTAADGTIGSAASDPVTSAIAPDPAAPTPTTSAAPSVTAAPDGGEGEDEIITSREKDDQPPYEESDDLPVRLEGETDLFVSCRISMVAKGDGASEYRTVRCAIHDAAYSRVMESLAAASPEEEKAVWEQAAEAFRQDLNDLYAACQDAATTSAAKTIVLSEQQLYLAQAENYRAYLLLLYPEDETLAARAYAEELMRKCAQLCYETHCAPEMRPDSYAALYGDLASVSPEAVCVRLNQEAEDMTCLFCRHHTDTEKQVTELVFAARSVNDLTLAWKQGEKLWRRQLDQIADQLFIASESEGDKDIVYAEQQSFYAWLDAREQFLRLLYADQPATVSEVITQEIWERTLSLCHFTDAAD